MKIGFGMRVANLSSHSIIVNTVAYILSRCLNGKDDKFANIALVKSKKYMYIKYSYFICCYTCHLCKMNKTDTQVRQLSNNDTL